MKYDGVTASLNCVFDPIRFETAPSTELVERRLFPSHIGLVFDMRGSFR
jgi:hypothetical protein